MRGLARLALVVLCLVGTLSCTARDGFGVPCPEGMRYQPYHPNGIDFGGSDPSWTTELEQPPLLGVANSQRLTLSTWFRDEDDGAETFLTSCDEAFGSQLTFDSDGGGGRMPALNLENSQDETLLRITDTAGLDALADEQWHHLLISVDFSDPDRVHFYIDDEDRARVLVWNDSAPDAVFDFTPSDLWRVGSSCGNRRDTSSAFADLWVDFGRYLDLSVEANRRRFIDADGAAVYLGARGDHPTGLMPDILLTGDAASWHLNRGTGGDFAVVIGGPLQPAISDPPAASRSVCLR